MSIKSAPSPAIVICASFKFTSRTVTNASRRSGLSLRCRGRTANVRLPNRQPSLAKREKRSATSVREFDDDSPRWTDFSEPLEPNGSSSGPIHRFGPPPMPNGWNRCTASTSKDPVLRSCRYGTSRLGPPGRGVRSAPLISHSQATAPDPQRLTRPRPSRGSRRRHDKSAGRGGVRPKFVCVRSASQKHAVGSLGRRTINTAPCPAWRATA